MVSKQTCTTVTKLDQSLWQTLGSFDYIYTSHKWTKATFYCGKLCTTLQIGTVSGLWFCQRCWRLKIDRRVEFCACLEVTHAFVPISWMCKKQTSVSQFYRRWNDLSRCRFKHGWNASSWCLGFGKRSVSFFTKRSQQHQRSSTRKLVA